MAQGLRFKAQGTRLKMWLVKCAIGQKSKPLRVFQNLPTAVPERGAGNRVWLLMDAKTRIQVGVRYGNLHQASTVELEQLMDGTSFRSDSRVSRLALKTDSRVMTGQGT